jgi:outer membrane protein assembly factor BamE (lipoprotein component of BamABCDE complex)
MRRLYSAREASCGIAGTRAAVPAGRAYLGLRGLVVAAVLALACTGCAETVTKHGHLFQESDLKQISPGMSTEQVRTSLGTPTTTAAVGSGTAFYYISSVESQKAFLPPKETDRRVVAVYFGQMGSVDRVAQYGLKDGKVFDYVKNETPTLSRDEGILKALFRNLGVKQFGLD